MVFGTPARIPAHVFLGVVVLTFSCGIVDTVDDKCGPQKTAEGYLRNTSPNFLTGDPALNVSVYYYYDAGWSRFEWSLHVSNICIETHVRPYFQLMIDNRMPGLDAVQPFGKVEWQAFYEEVIEFTSKGAFDDTLTLWEGSSPADGIGLKTGFSEGPGNCFVGTFVRFPSLGTREQDEQYARGLVNRVQWGLVYDEHKK